jgi:hypothetical protein
MGAMAARIESLATDGSYRRDHGNDGSVGQVSMRSRLHSRMCGRATLSRHAQMRAKLKRIFMKP